MTTQIERDLQAMFERREDDVVTAFVVPDGMQRRIRMLRLTYATAGLVVVGALAFGAITLTNDSSGAGKNLGPADQPTIEPQGEVQGNAPKLDELVGTWTVTGEEAAVRFSSDGSVAFATSVGRLGVPDTTGRFELEGEVVTFSGGCLTEQEWQTGIILGYNPFDDALDVLFTEEGCGVPAGTFWELKRVSE